MKRVALCLLLVLVAGAAAASLIFVDESEFVIVTQFGCPLAIIQEPGLHFKFPYQSVLRVDRRLQIYNPRPAEFLAGEEKKNINLDVFVCWRVSDPLRFLETVNDLPGAEARLHDIVWSELAATVGSNPLEALVSIEPAKYHLGPLVAEVTRRAAERAAAVCGVNIVDVRLKRIGLPSQVRESVFPRMRAERGRMARGLRAEGEKEATIIRAQADKDRQIKLAEAYETEQKIRGTAEAEAMRVYGAAHQKDPAFYELLRTLEAYKKILDEKTTILLSGDSELLKYLTRGAEVSATVPTPVKVVQPAGNQTTKHQ